MLARLRRAEDLICDVFEVSSAADFSHMTRERDIPRAGVVQGSQWHCQLHGGGSDLCMERNRGGSDYDFARPEPDGGRLDLCDRSGPNTAEHG